MEQLALSPGVLVLLMPGPAGCCVHQVQRGQRMLLLLLHFQPPILPS
jgi:hypothetical protein